MFQISKIESNDNFTQTRFDGVNCTMYIAVVVSLLFNSSKSPNLIVVKTYREAL